MNLAFQDETLAARDSGSHCPKGAEDVVLIQIFRALATPIPFTRSDVMVRQAAHRIHMRTLLPCLVIMGIAIGCSRGERATQASNGVAKELSAPKQSALDKVAPDFQRFSLSEYSPQVAEYSRPPTNEPLNRADGDFNGDGIPDVALHGYDRTRELVIVLLSRSDSSYQAIPIGEWPLYHHDRGNATFIVATPAGPLEIPEGLRGIDTPPPPQTLPHGGVSIINDGQAGQLFYWNGSRFVAVTTGD
jgi:hypothetical protein